MKSKSIWRGKYWLIHLEIVKRPKKWNYKVEILLKLLKSPHIFILFELDFDVKFPLLRLLLFISDLKSIFLYYTWWTLIDMHIFNRSTLYTIYILHETRFLFYTRSFSRQYLLWNLCNKIGKYKWNNSLWKG